MSYYDICSNRHRGNAQSIEANKRASFSKNTDSQAILNLLSKESLTSKEIAEKLQKTLHSISGRLSELKQAGYIKATQETRLGCAVLELVTLSENERTLITNAVRREQIVKTILDLVDQLAKLETAAKWNARELDRMINQRFQVMDGLDALDFVLLEEVRDGLQLRIIQLVESKEK